MKSHNLQNSKMPIEKGARLIKNDSDAKPFYEIIEFCGL